MGDFQHHADMIGSYAANVSDNTAGLSIDPRLLTSSLPTQTVTTWAELSDNESSSERDSTTLYDDFSTPSFVDNGSNPTLPQPMPSPISSYFVTDLFGPGSGSVPITGSRSAITQLMKDKSTNSLFVQPDIPSSVQEAVTISHHHLQVLDIFPDVEHLCSRVGLKEDYSNPFGIDADDHLTSQSNIDLDFTFLNFNMAKALAALKTLAAYHDHIILIGHGMEQKSIFQIGIITSFPSAEHKVELFNSGEATEYTATIWLYRACSIDEEGMMQEVWRPVSDGTHSSSTTLPSAPLPAALSRKRTSEAIGDGPSTGIDSASPSITDPTPPRPIKRARQRATYPTDRPSDYLFALYPEEIFGRAILHLARWYSNTELFERLNHNLAAQNKKLIVDVNVITRRITNAIASLAMSCQGLTREGLRQDLDAARKDNGVKKRMEERTKVKKAFNKAVREIVEEAAAGGEGMENVEDVVDV